MLPGGYQVALKIGVRRSYWVYGPIRIAMDSTDAEFVHKAAGTPVDSTDAQNGLYCQNPSRPVDSTDEANSLALIASK
jgi:hypothetical protein